MLAALRTVFDRSFTSVCARQGIAEDTSFRNALWAEMTADASAPPAPKTLYLVIADDGDVVGVFDSRDAAAAEATGERYVITRTLGPAIPPAPTSVAPLERAESLHIPVADDSPVPPVVAVVPPPPPQEDEEEKEDTKLTPLQRLEKQLRTTTEKLDKVRARQGTAKQTAKQKEADPAEMAKLEAKVVELQGKLAKAAEPKPEKKKAEPKPKAEPKKKAAAKKEEPAPEPAPPAPRSNAATAGPDEDDEALNAAVDAVEAKAAAADDADEEVYEVKLEGKVYTVGEKSHRVDLVTEKGDVPVIGDFDLIARVLEKLGGAPHSD